MKIYIAHPSSMNFAEELYKPLRNSSLNNKHSITLPHENSSEPYALKEMIGNFDVLIADVSFPSTGMGIELGWADMKSVRIICVYKKGSSPSTALKTITNEFVEYTSSEGLILRLEEML